MSVDEIAISLQGKMTYEVTGDPPAHKFFSIGRNNGTLFVKSNLKLDRGKAYMVGTARSKYIQIYIYRRRQFY